ncbi:DUF6965 family protein [Pedobacter frigoris]|uniref:DUF6965 domain-containing protein n=1 Tax=Pedobacter frigoris TaxID=2571272 RepID=A0A4V5NYW1_9SPHI|nr:hypothetical protein [Pedobacter frigoris]TKC04350.1 hypothetical protein FA047_17350 [Pedobacter frigoris]
MIQELKDYFNSIEIPKEPVYLDPSARINDVGLFLKSHFKALEENPDSKVNEPIKSRLVKLKEILEQKAEYPL